MPPLIREYALLLDGEAIGYMRRSNKLPEGNLVRVLCRGKYRQAAAVLLHTLEEADQARAMRSRYVWNTSSYKEE